MKALVLRLVRLLVGLFYRRVEVSGAENAPAAGPVIFVANHFNGLVDPMLVLYALPRPVVFVAKSTLWRVPVLRSLLDLLEVVPVVRKKDLADTGGPQGEDRNQESFQRLAATLDAGGAVLIFPEGRSHSDPRLSELRTGSARVLLLSKKIPVVIPVGFWFTKKEEFRSDVLIRVGAPLTAPREPTVEAWTAAIREGLERVTLNAEDWEDHEVVAAVDALYGTKIPEEGRRTTGDFLEGKEGKGRSGPSSAPLPLARAFRNRQVLLTAREVLKRVEPGAVASVARRAHALGHLLRKIALSPGALDDPPSAGVILWNSLKALFLLSLGFPVAVLGVAAWWIPYRLTGTIANRVPDAQQHRDQIALYKLLAGVVLFPFFLFVELVVVWSIAGAAWALATLFVLPFAGIFSLWYLEHAAWRERQARELLAIVFSRKGLASLREKRDTLVAECDRLAEVYRRETGDNRAS